MIQGEAERIGTVHPGEEKAERKFTNVYNLSGSKEDGARLLSSVQ